MSARPSMEPSSWRTAINTAETSLSGHRTVVPLGFDAWYLQALARADTVALNAVDLANGFDRHPQVL